MFSRSIKFIALITIILLAGSGALAQENTKGDRPSQTRETRFSKSGKKSKIKTVKERGRKTRTHRAYKTRTKQPGGEKAAAPVAPLKNIDPEKRKAKPNAPSRNKRVQVRSEGRNRNVYPQSGPFVNNPSPTPRDNQRAQSNRPALARLKNLQGPERKPGRKTRVVTRSASRSYTARKSINIQASYPRPKRKPERATTRDISGRRLRTRNYESPRPGLTKPSGGTEKLSLSKRLNNWRSSSERYGRYSNFSSSRDRNPGRRRKVTPRSASASGRKFFSQSGMFISNPSKTPRSTERGQSNKETLRVLKTLQSRRAPEGGRKSSVVPRSASGSFRASKSTNTWAHFPRPKRKGERATTRDLAGKPLRTRNYQSPRPGLVDLERKPYDGRRRVGERAYKGPAAGTHVSRTRSGRAWLGDIAGRKIRGIKKPKSDRASRDTGRGYKSITGQLKRQSGALPARVPGIGARRIGNYTGNRAVKKPFQDQGSTYSGNIKKRRALKPQGETYSGNVRSRRAYNDQGEEFTGNVKKRKRSDAQKGIGYTGKIRRGSKVFNDQGEEFTGTIRARRPLKGGGSRSTSWNNEGRPIEGQTPGGGDVARYQGTLKARRPEKGGGGSVSGRAWNNKNTPLPVRAPGTGYDRVGKFQGTVKAQRKDKGGGSISGRPWNNNGQAIAGRRPSRAANVATIPPGTRRSAALRVFNDQGEEYTGAIKAKRPEKGGGSVSGKLWNNKETPIAVRTPASSAKVDQYTGNIKQSRFGKDYVRNPNASRLSLKASKPSKHIYDVENLQVKVKQYQYVKNNSSDKESLKVREPGKAFGKSTDYQGNIKMQKFALFGTNKKLHPDAQFVKLNKNNVAQEKDALTNFKLWWARLFKKNETQPEHLKDKERKPRYDPKEKGLWYD
jgi:hypothetical protein